jgi:polyphenol oxidase
MTLPALPDTFSWTHEPWGRALRCTPLQAIAPHLFTTRELPLSCEDDWRQLAASLGAEHVQLLTQVHGRRVFVVNDRRPDELPHAQPAAAAQPSTAGKPEADVLVSNDPRTAVAVRAADCVPILIADPRSGAVAAVHAGWRGSAAGAGPAGVDALAREFGARPADLVAAIGPAIGPCCYEVGSELVDAFAAAGHARHLVDRWFLSPPPMRGVFERGALRLDVPGANHDQLVLAGLAEENIHASELCTACHLDLFPSYRVEKQQAGRLAAAIRAR